MAKIAKIFVLDRKEDNTGNSGTGIIADGIEFPCGKVVVCWRGPKSSVVIWNNIDEMRDISCTPSKIMINWKDSEFDTCSKCMKDLSSSFLDTNTILCGKCYKDNNNKRMLKLIKKLNEDMNDSDDSEDIQDYFDVQNKKN
jgi:hypothetical protein